jgi:hypothetical protein
MGARLDQAKTDLVHLGILLILKRPYWMCEVTSLCRVRQGKANDLKLTKYGVIENSVDFPRFWTVGTLQGQKVASY